MRPASVHEGHDFAVEELVPTQFPYDSVDRALIEDDPDGLAARELSEAWAREEKSGQGAEILLRLVEMLLPNNLQKGSHRGIGTKVICLAWMLQSSKGGIGEKSLKDIAATLGVTRALLSYFVRRYEDTLGMHARGQKLSSSVPSYETSAHTGWKTRRANAAKKSDGDHPPNLTPEVGYEADHAEKHSEQP